jgi:hypothetical protein
MHCRFNISLRKNTENTYQINSIDDDDDYNNKENDGSDHTVINNNTIPTISNNTTTSTTTTINTNKHLHTRNAIAKDIIYYMIENSITTTTIVNQKNQQQQQQQHYHNHHNQYYGMIYLLEIEKVQSFIPHWNIKDIQKLNRTMDLLNEKFKLPTNYSMYTNIKKFDISIII